MYWTHNEGKSVVAGENINKVLAQELDELVIKNFERRRVDERFNDNPWAADI